MIHDVNELVLLSCTLACIASLTACISLLDKCMFGFQMEMQLVISFLLRTHNLVVAVVLTGLVSSQLLVQGELERALLSLMSVMTKESVVTSHRLCS